MNTKQLAKSQPKPSRPAAQLPAPARGFVSLRWRFLLPLAVVLLPLAMLGAYAVAYSLGLGFAQAQDNLLLMSSRTVNQRARTLAQQQLSEARRVAYTVGVPQAVINRDATALQDTLEALARAGGLECSSADPGGGLCLPLAEHMIFILTIIRPLRSDDSRFIRVGLWRSLG